VLPDAAAWFTEIVPMLVATPIGVLPAKRGMDKSVSAETSANEYIHFISLFLPGTLNPNANRIATYSLVNHRSIFF
jgi:hypothetical protein